LKSYITLSAVFVNISSEDYLRGLILRTSVTSREARQSRNRAMDVILLQTEDLPQKNLILRTRVTSGETRGQAKQKQSDSPD
jgi:hypothetical protein